MPQADIKASSDLQFDAVAILKEIEDVINTHDHDAGACKGRFYPTDQYYHTHMLVSVTMLPKPYRTKEFIDELMGKLETAIKAHLTQSCQFALGIELSDKAYMTHYHEV